MDGPWLRRLQTLKAHLKTFRKLKQFRFDFDGGFVDLRRQNFKELAREFKIELGNNYHDCGMLVYDLDNQPVFGEEAAVPVRR